MNTGTLLKLLKTKYDNAVWTAKQYKSCTDGSYDLCLYKVRRLKRVVNYLKSRIKRETV